MCARTATDAGERLAAGASTGFGVVGDTEAFWLVPNSESSCTIGWLSLSAILNVDELGLSLMLNPPIFASWAFTAAGLSIFTVEVIFPRTVPRISRIPGWPEIKFRNRPKGWQYSSLFNGHSFGIS